MLNQTGSFHLQVCLILYNILVETSVNTILEWKCSSKIYLKFAGTQFVFVLATQLDIQK